MAIASERRYVFTVILLLCLIFPVASNTLATDEVTQKSKQLQELKKSIDKIKKDRSAVVVKERNTLAELKKIEKQLSQKEKELRIHEHNLALSEKELERLRNDLSEAELRLKQTQAMMLSRLRAMYKFGYRHNHPSYLTLLLGVDSISDITTKYKYVSAVAEGDKNLLDKAVAEKTEIDFRKKLVEDKKEQILSYKLKTEKIKKEIMEKRNSRQVTLAKLRSSKEDLTRAIQEKERAVRELESLIARLRADSEKKGLYKGPYEEVVSNLGGQGGKLPWPVSGKIIPNIAPSMKGVTIQATYGAEIRCVDNGIVEYARWFDGVGYGQMVIVNHGNGYRTLYAHASEILVKEGQKVSKGQVIAKVGDTGSISGPVLYFEVWKGAQALSTRQWLMDK